MRAGLRDAGFVEGQSVWLEIRYADGEIARLAALAAELVALNPDVIFAGSAPALVATHNATKTIPVVIESLRRSDRTRRGEKPGEAGRKRHGDLCRRRDRCIDWQTPVASETSGAQLVTRRSDDCVGGRDKTPSCSVCCRPRPVLGLTYRVFEVGSSTKLDSAFTEAARDGLQGLFISQNPYFFSRRVEVAALAARARLPAIYQFS